VAEAGWGAAIGPKGNFHLKPFIESIAAELRGGRA
jgi:hypothetical protein